MTPLKTRLLRSSLDVLYYSRVSKMMQSSWAGAGIIFTLHHVLEANNRSAFAPNRILEISRDFLEAVIRKVIASGYDVVSLDELHRRLVEKDFRRRMACFTLDDGYVDNYSIAYPLFKQYDVPFCIYVTSGLMEHEPLLWWRVLEKVVDSTQALVVDLGAEQHRFVTDSPERKYEAYDKVYWALRAMTPQRCASTVAELAQEYGVDAHRLSEESALSWPMICEMSGSGLLTVGAHTRSHRQLKKLSDSELEHDVQRGRECIEERVGAPIEHFAYPYGDASSAGPREFGAIDRLGFKTGTTTRKGLIFAEHAQHLHALPRVSLNGDYQLGRYVDVFMSGAPFALRQRFRRLDVH